MIRASIVLEKNECKSKSTQNTHVCYNPFLFSSVSITSYGYRILIYIAKIQAVTPKGHGLSHIHKFLF